MKGGGGTNCGRGNKKGRGISADPRRGRGDRCLGSGIFHGVPGQGEDGKLFSLFWRTFALTGMEEEFSNSLDDGGWNAYNETCQYIIS